MREVEAAINSGMPLVLRPDNVEHMNSLQVMNASRFIMAARDDFRLAKEMIQDEPHLKSPPTFVIA